MTTLNNLWKSIPNCKALGSLPSSSTYPLCIANSLALTVLPSSLLLWLHRKLIQTQTGLDESRFGKEETLKTIMGFPIPSLYWHTRPI